MNRNLQKLKKGFSTVSGVSNNMLVSLSLAHLDSKKFQSNSEMTNFLSNNGFLNFKETSDTMEKLDRRQFIRPSDFSEEEIYSLKALNYCKGVDVTNPMM